MVLVLVLEQGPALEWGVAMSVQPWVDVDGDVETSLTTMTIWIVVLI